jgi:hypothetical protein
VDGWTSDGVHDSGVDAAVRRIADRLRPACGDVSEPELARLAAHLFLEGACFALDWSENRGCGSPPRSR